LDGDSTRRTTGQAARRQAKDAWRDAYDQGVKRDDVDLSTISGLPIEPLYTSSDLERIGYIDEFPGDFPYTRGIHPSGYRGRLWTMRQFAGFGTAKQTNERYKFLLEQGPTGLSVAFDMPALIGHDSDHPRALGEVGKCGVAIAMLGDMTDLFAGIDLGSITTSMTIKCTAPVALVM